MLLDMALEYVDEEIMHNFNKSLLFEDLKEKEQILIFHEKVLELENPILI